MHSYGMAFRGTDVVLAWINGSPWGEYETPVSIGIARIVP